MDDRIDDRTLRLASLGLDAERLERYLTYQRALSSALGAPAPSDEAFHRAHALALAQSRLGPDELEGIRSVVRRFAGNRATARRLSARLAAAVPERAEKLREELGRLDAELTRRDDPKTVELLSSRVQELVSLHERLGRFG